MDADEQMSDVPNPEGGRPYVVFKDRRYLGGQTRKITKTLPRTVLDQMVVDALASCPPSAGGSVRSLSFKYDLRKDRWVATTITREALEFIYPVGIFTLGSLAALFLIFMLIRVV
jgi:hypothetical protein